LTSRGLGLRSALRRCAAPPGAIRCANRPRAVTTACRMLLQHATHSRVPGRGSRWSASRVAVANVNGAKMTLLDSPLVQAPAARAIAPGVRRSAHVRDRLKPGGTAVNGADTPNRSGRSAAIAHAQPNLVACRGIPAGSRAGDEVATPFGPRRRTSPRSRRRRTLAPRAGGSLRRAHPELVADGYPTMCLGARSPPPGRRRLSPRRLLPARRAGASPVDGRSSRRPTPMAWE